MLPPFRDLPEAVLGAIVIHAVAHLADVDTLKYYAKLRTGSIWVALVALLGVLQMGILKGLIFAVGLNSYRVDAKAQFSAGFGLGQTAGLGELRRRGAILRGRTGPGSPIFRPNGVLFSHNANRVHSRLRELIKTIGPSVRAVIINLEASPEIDVTCLEMLARLRSELRKSEVQLCFARVADPVRDPFKRSGFVEMSEGVLFRGVDSAVTACLGAMRAESVPPDLRLVAEHEQ